MSAMMDQDLTKFRPVLSSSEIMHIISLCKKDASAASMSVLSRLVMYEYKIKNSVLKPAYTESEPLISSLGFSEKSKELHEVHPEALYNLWLVQPESLTVLQLSQVRQWRYDHDKMTMDEEKTFEHEVLGV